MCGIVGYIGLPEKSVEHHALDVLVEGLRRLEYRGYDSAGVATVAGGAVEARKKSGKLANLIAEIEQVPLTPASVGIGHTRWATHGGPTDLNAHPHFGDDGRLAVIHNGIIENFAQLRQRLSLAGHVFESQTDTEVAAKLIGEAFQNTGDLTEAMRQAVNDLEGAFTLLVVHPDQPDRVVAARRNSPLVVGLGEGENFLGSDVSGFIDFTREAVELEQDQIVTITAGDVSIINFDGSAAAGKRFHIDWDATAAEKGGYDSFMEKEINEQPKAVEDTLLGRTDAEGRLTLDELRISPEQLKNTSKIIVLACGTAAYAGTVAKYAIEHWTRIPVEVELAHEFRYRDPIIDASTLVVSISQSGETMDTLMAVRYAKEQGARTLSICNTNGSTIPRESDAVLYLHAGPEIAVASTKAFLAMIAASYLLGLYLAQLRGQLFSGQISDILADLHKIPAKIQTILDSAVDIKSLAQAMAQTPSVLFLGRHVGFPVAMEGALKLKELAYIHAEGFAAGELKHGPIALIEEGQPVFVVVPSPRGRDSLHGKVVSNIQEVRARGAKTITVAEEGDEAVREFSENVFFVPETQPLLMPLLTTVPLQIFACALASEKGYDVDQPRNLAKSVTVE
ncbi:glutamine--fructose-6-phosphate transaminase (isomerizing) [Nesterenkonia natronophila]|uniref:Glutamine--fructose-6-phosphate aminotransferase [isomerizing] n=1 Tax=Nesterenkonia natronophila TaxID=2174932 RepID=A0A3A4F5J2_9MICC|nr:glutamine--fructose-6-phosphate transaminase (isomerizing) [Nesterenkonia natronophila]RJN31730.1 glutamine--fructose-6-phosphate transaminase (isomerizing) [Nesterenkonia natronophila]